MNTNYIKNAVSLARTPARKDCLSIVEAGLHAINTHDQINKFLSLEGDMLRADGHTFDLKNFDTVTIFAFGKASVEAVEAVEEILGDRITDGIALDKREYTGKKIYVHKGSHPHPSTINVDISTRIADKARGLGEKDLAIVIVSGGGSALLCYPTSECDQGNRLYDDFTKKGGTIRELNTVRKHISAIKGGNFAKLLYPATVVSLILCDVLGDHYDEVASGPTYKDTTTILDAQALLDKYHITDTFELTETPKEDIYFEKVYNIPVVANTKALEAMKEKAESLGYTASIFGDELSDHPSDIIRAMKERATPRSVILGSGEPSIEIAGEGGIGGRNEYTTLSALPFIDKNTTFVSIASDGIDNASAYAGGIADQETVRLITEKQLDVEKALATFQEEPLLAMTNDLIETGSTGANVSDLLVLLTS